MYGTQTVSVKESFFVEFENDVKMYGTQTSLASASQSRLFENDVKMYGTQTACQRHLDDIGLRMM